MTDSEDHDITIIDETGAGKQIARAGQQVATLVTTYSSWDQKGQIALDSFVVTQKGLAGMDDDISKMSNGDFKFNLKLEHDSNAQAAFKKEEEGHDDVSPHLKMFSSRYRLRLLSSPLVTISMKLWGLTRLPLRAEHILRPVEETGQSSKMGESCAC